LLFLSIDLFHKVGKNGKHGSSAVKAACPRGQLQIFLGSETKIAAVGDRDMTDAESGDIPGFRDAGLFGNMDKPPVNE